MEKEMTINRETKSLLAKLMASENIHVEYSANATTAMFDTEGRTLIMPVLKDITESATDLFLGHEVGHALYTPQGAIKEVVKKGSHFKNLVNIVEDARIEKMIQNKFPGLKRSFYNGYSDLIKSKFFDLENNDVADMNFMDRLNIHFKVGIRAGVEFSAEEMPFVDRIKNQKTFDETLNISNDLFDYIKDNADPDEDEEDLFGNPDPQSEENGNEEMGDVESNGGGSADSGDNNEADSEESEESGDDSPGNGSGSESEEDSEKEAKGSTSEASDEDSDSDSGSDTDSGEVGGDDEEVTNTGEGSDSSSGMIPSLSNNQADDLTSKTQESFDKGVEEHLESSEYTVYNATIPNIDPSLVIVPMEKVHEKLMEGQSNGPTLVRQANEKWVKFRSENKSLISYMAKEFEMRKSADEHKRTRTAKTGVLNPNKLHAFKFSEDLFLRNSVVTEGKNHGFVMFVDWSGSMHTNMRHTLDQLTLLAMFCKKINIPFDVYAFTSCFKDPNRSESEGLFGDWVKPNDVVITEGFDLLHLVSSTLSTAKFNTSMTYLRWLREGMDPANYYNNDFRLPNSLRLGGTPLNECIIAAMPIVDMLRKKNNVQIINSVFLTDGQGHGLSKQWVRTATDDPEYIVPQNANGINLRTKSFTSYGYQTKVFLTDAVTKKVYEIAGSRHSKTETGILLKMLRDRSDARVAGFFIANGNRRSLHGDVAWMDSENYMLTDQIADDFKKQGWSEVENDAIGYQKFFVLSNKNLKVESEEFETPMKNGVVAKGRLKNAFIKSRKGKIGNKTMLSKFAEFVS